MKLNKAVYLSSLLLFIIYMVSANYIFITLIRFKNESSLVKMDLPEKSLKIKMHIDSLDEIKIKWKNMITIKGWAIKLDQVSEERDLYLVLQSKKKVYTFSIEADMLPRPGVTEHFNLDSNFKKFGFECLIAKDKIKDGTYRLGVVLEDDTGRSSGLSDQYLTILNGNLYEGIISTKIRTDLERAERDVIYYIDAIEEQNGFIGIRGWSFLEGLDACDIKVYILLKKDDARKLFNTAAITRKGVTAHFKEYGLNLDDSGFEAKIPKDILEEGIYQVGLYIVKGEERGLIFTDRNLEISH